MKKILILITLLVFTILGKSQVTNDGDISKNGKQYLDSLIGINTNVIPYIRSYTIKTNDSFYVASIVFKDGTRMTTSGGGSTPTLQQVLDQDSISTTGFKVESSSLIGIGNASPFAILTLNSTTKGFMIPRMTIVQRLAMADAENGTQVYDTDLHAVFIKEGENWIQ